MNCFKCSKRNCKLVTWSSYVVKLRDKSLISDKITVL